MATAQIGFHIKLPRELVQKIRHIKVDRQGDQPSATIKEITAELIALGMELYEYRKNAQDRISLREKEEYAESKV